MDLKTKIREINDFPEKGIIFRDITTLLRDANALKDAILQMEEKTNGLEYDMIIGPESRGFIFGMPIAYNQNKGFVPVRKKGKLPAKVVQKEYNLEYGTAVIEMHADALQKGQKVLIIDDLLATGGTTKAIIQLVEEMGAEVSGLVFLIELLDLKGRSVLEGYHVNSVIQY